MPRSLARRLMPLGLLSCMSAMSPAFAGSGSQDASLVAQRLPLDEPFFYPVQLDKLALFGPVRPPSAAAAVTQADATTDRWSMFWVPALSRRVIRAQPLTDKALGLELLKVSAPPVLQGILGLVQAKLKPIDAHTFEVFNPDPTARAFLVRSTRGRAKIQIQHSTLRYPDLAWESAFRSFWADSTKSLPPAAWFDHNPEHPARLRLLALRKARAELAQGFPSARSFVSSLEDLQRLSWATRLRPITSQQRTQEYLCQPLADTPCDFQEGSDQYRSLGPRERMTLTLQGGRLYELRARQNPKVSELDPAHPSELSVWKDSLNLGDLEVFAPPSSAQPRATDLDSESVPGAIARFRFWLPKGKHTLTFRNQGAEIRTSLRAIVSPKRVSASLAGASIQSNLNNAQASLRTLSSTQADLAQALAEPLLAWTLKPAEPQQRLHHFDQLCSPKRPWVCAQLALNLASDHKIPLAALTTRLRSACDALRTQKQSDPLAKLGKQQQVAKLARALRARGQGQSAKACLGRLAPIAHADYLQEQLRTTPTADLQQDPTLAAAYGWLAQGKANASLRSRFWERWRQWSKPVSQTPLRAAQATRFRWLSPLTKEPRSATRSWTQLAPNQPYLLKAQDPQVQESRPKVLRLALSHAPRQRLKDPASSEAIVQIGPDRHRVPLDKKYQVLSWIVSPQAHFIQVHAPEGTRIYSDHPPGEGHSKALGSFREETLWSASTPKGPTPFTLPEHSLPLPVSLRLRVSLTDSTSLSPQGSPTPRGKIALRLHSDTSPPRKFWIHYAPQIVDPALNLGDFGPASYPLSIPMGPMPGATKVWLETPASSPSLALSVQTRGIRRPPTLDPFKAPLENKDEVIYSAQGPQSVAQRLRRAQRLLANRRLSELRDELEWILKRPLKELQAERASILALSHKLSQLDQRPSFDYFTPWGANPRVSLRASFLDRNDQSSPPKTNPKSQATLLKQAQSLREQRYSSIASSLDAIVDYMDNDAPRRFDPLVYGMLSRISTILSGPKINAWLETLAQATQWKTLQFARRSQGHEWLRLDPSVSKTAPSKQAQRLAAPWGEEPLLIASNRARTLSLSRAQAGRIRVEALCRDHSPKPSIKTSTLWIQRDRHTRQALPLSPGKVNQTTLRVFSGHSTLTFSLHNQPDRSCGLRLLEQTRKGGPWLPLNLSKSQRWFVGTPEQSLEFRAQGPGSLLFDLRTLTNDLKTGDVRLTIHSPTGRRFERSLALQTEIDPALRLERNPHLRVSAASEHLSLMPEQGTYRFVLQGPQAELLARAHTRVASPAKNRIPHLPGLTQALRQRLHQAPSPWPIRPQSFVPPNQLHKGASNKPGSLSPVGVWTFGGRAGLQADSEYEKALPRWTTQADLGWLRAWVRRRLWTQTSMHISSENRVRPAFWLQARVYGASRRSWLRTQFTLRGAGQSLNRWAHAYGLWGRVRLSTRALVNPLSTFDLRPELRVSYRGYSKTTQEIAQSRFAEGLHASIYRHYIKDHPFSMRPRLELHWRPFYDLRTVAGQDLWFNADMQSLDRLRSWIGLSGILDPFRRVNRSIWHYETGYRFTFAPMDPHRLAAYTRHELSLGLAVHWRKRLQRRWSLQAHNTVILQSNATPTNRFMLSASVAFDAAGPIEHRPSELRPYPHELQPAAWAYTEPNPESTHGQRQSP